MTREQLEHIIRASAKLTDQYEIMVFGSQAILGADPNPPAVFIASMEADVYPLAAPELAAKIEGTIGELLQHKYPTAEEAIQKVPLMDVESRPEFGLTTRTLLARIRRWAKDAAIG
jgi:hypothetical protein